MKSSELVLGIVSSDAPPFFGGMGRHVGQLIEGFRREGIQVHVFDRSYRKFAYALGKNIGFSFGLRFRLQKFVKTHGITVLHVHSGPGGVLLPFFPKSVKIVVTANHTYADQSRLPGQSWKKLLMQLERKTYQRSDAIIAISRDTAESLQADYGIPASRITVIGCGFDLAPWISADSDIRQKNACVFVGRPSTRKGWDLLMQAWPMVREKIPTATLSVVGWHEVSRDGMQFLGRISDHELQTLLGSSQLTVCPSRLEGFGLAAAESIACGTPVVAARALGLRDTVDDFMTGILVDISPETLAGGMIRMLQDQELWKTLHRGCREGRSRFDLTKEISAHRELFRALYS